MRSAKNHRCSYVVLLERTETAELRELANYLSGIGLADCDVVILDPSPRFQFETNARTLRWVGRHINVRGGFDLVRAALQFAACEKVIVANDDVRYAAGAIAQTCDLLDKHEAVEPQDYLDPITWWSGIDAGRILIHRGIEPQPDHRATFAFRRNALRSLRSVSSVSDLATQGVNVHAAIDLFVRREPREFSDWLFSRPIAAGEDFALPVKTAFFLSLVPLLLLLAVAGGFQLASGYAGIIGFTAVALAIRGRSGAQTFFPLRACIFAPLWILERSLSVYWALFLKIRGVDAQTARPAVPDRARGQRVASGE